MYGLACLRILSRGKQSVALMSSVDSLGIIALLGDISSEQDKRKFDGDLQEQDVKGSLVIFYDTIIIYILRSRIVTLNLYLYKN